MWRTKVRIATAAAIGALAFLAALAGAAPLFGGGSGGSLVALLIAISVFIVVLVIPGGRVTPLASPAITLPPVAIPERPPGFGFLKWWEFRRALYRAREVTRAEAEAEGLDAMATGKSPSFSMVTVLRRLEAREREVYERFGFVGRPPPPRSRPKRGTRKKYDAEQKSFTAIVPAGAPVSGSPVADEIDRALSAADSEAPWRIFSIVHRAAREGRLELPSDLMNLDGFASAYIHEEFRVSGAPHRTKDNQEREEWSQASTNERSEADDYPWDVNVRSDPEILKTWLAEVAIFLRTGAIHRPRRFR